MLSRSSLRHLASSWTRRGRGSYYTRTLSFRVPTRSELTVQRHCSFSTDASSPIQGPHGSYQDEYDLSLKDPKAFWARAAEQIEWYRKPTQILDASDPHFPHWFPDGVMNLCYNCLDVHIPERGSQVALYYDSPVTGVKEQYTYAELLEQVATFAGALQDLNVQTGDRVVIYMPMIPQTVIALLACSRIGAIHSVVFGGFASRELASRITDSKPKIVISASMGVEPTRKVPYKPLLDEALELADHTVEHTIIVQRQNLEKCKMGLKDLDYDQLMAQASPVDPVPLPANHLAHLLYTSGTTASPKGIVRETAGWAVALKYSMSAFYDTNAGETFWTNSDVGWVVGQAYTIYAPLLQGCSTVLYEGKPTTPDAGAFWRVIEEYNVKTLFVAPTAFRAIKQADPQAELVKNYDLSSFRSLFLA
jgi:propionyl-CoA synthetase